MIRRPGGANVFPGQDIPFGRHRRFQQLRSHSSWYHQEYSGYLRYLKSIGKFAQRTAFAALLNKMPRRTTKKRKKSGRPTKPKTRRLNPARRGRKKRRTKSIVGMVRLSKDLALAGKKMNVVNYVESLRSVSAQNKCAYHSRPLGTLALYNAALDSGILQYDKQGAGQETDKLDVTGGETGGSATNLRNVDVQVSAEARYTFRNNTGVTTHMWYWIIAPRGNVNQGPQTTYDQGILDLKDVDGNANDSTQPCFWPKHSQQFNEKFKIIKKCTHIVFYPGDEYSITMSAPKYMWSAENDARMIAAGVQANKYTRYLFFRTQGSIAHDQTLPTDIGYAPSALDSIGEAKYKFRTQFQDARYIQVSNTLETMATPVQTHVEVADCQLDLPAAS